MANAFASKYARPLVATAIAVIACGLQLWPTVNTGRSALPLWLLLGTISGVAAGLLMRGRFLLPVLTVAAGFGIADVARIVFDTTRDPSSHNLWPFELFITIILGEVGGVVGVSIVLLIRRVIGSARGTS